MEFNITGESLVMEEHPSGCYVDIDRRSLRLNPGQSGRVGVYARRLGNPLAGLVVNFSLQQQKAIAAVETILLDGPGEYGYPTDPNRLINSEPRDVLLHRPGPLQVMTDRAGYARLTIAAKPGEFILPAAREAIDSQLYFLGEPDGWQTSGAIGPNNGELTSHRVGAGCVLTVLVYNTRPIECDPTWDDIKGWLSEYALLYPAMIDESRLNLGLQDQVDRDAYEIYRRLKCIPFDDVQYMPISRNLSDYRRGMILAYLGTRIHGKPPC